MTIDPDTKLWISESYVNATKGWRIGDVEPYETMYYAYEQGKLYRLLQREYGRCISKVYIDVAGSKPKAMGWVFQKRQRYEDVNETYLAETWISLHTAPDTVTREPHYKTISSR